MIKGVLAISFYGDDIEWTVAELRGRRVEFRDEITERQLDHPVFGSV